MSYSHAVKVRYQPDLKGFLRECELNYGRLLQLLPSPRVGDCYFYHVGDCNYQLTVDEETPFTCVMSVLVLRGNVRERWLPAMKIRLYHDVGVAEVLASRQIRVLKSRYDYPNAMMQQPDEKRQLNRFLGEWLCHCLSTAAVRLGNQG